VPRGRVVAALVLVWLIAGCASRGPILANSLDRAGVPANVDLVDVPFFPQEEYQCGPAALATVLSYSGLALTQISWRRTLSTR
jgi:hypothetical protein